MSTSYNNIILNEAILVVCVYLLARLTKNRVWVYWGVTAIGIIQATYAILQYCGVTESRNIIFSTTGFMGNPGLLGGFQAIALLALLVIYRKEWCSLAKYVWILASFLIFSSLILADSRASFLAVIAGLFILTFQYWCILLKKHRWLWIAMVCVLMIVTIILYRYRPDSANSRLLIWRVCADMFSDKPLFGFGAGGFNMNFMLYLCNFLETHPGHLLSSYAANTFFPYNEFIKILIEFGFIGLLLFATIIIVIFKKCRDKKLTAPLVVLLVFALFSFPSYDLCFTLTFPLLLGILHPLQNIRPSRRAILVIIIVCLTGTCSLNIFHEQDKFKKHLDQIYMGNFSPDSIDFINKYFNNNHSVIKVNAMYSTVIKNVPNILSESNIPLLFPSSDNWCTIGRHYLDIGDFVTAEKYFKQASQMVPSLIEPKYLLWRIYILQRNDVDAKALANDIIHMKVKTENTYTLRIKSEIFRYNYMNRMQ